MSWPTTRRHPRSLAQAFPRDHAAAITHYRAPGRFVNAACAVVGWVGVIAIAGLAAVGVLGN